MRALVVTNMWPTPERPALGSFVRDQVDALRRTGEVDVEVFAFGGGSGSLAVYPKAAARLAREHRGERYDVVHAHFGLSGWVALAAGRSRRVITLHGNDVRHPRSRALTRAVLPLTHLVGAASAALVEEVPGAARERAVVLPVGVALDRFRPIPREEARQRLGLPQDEPCVLFCHDPARAVKRFDLAQDAAGDLRVLTLGKVEPQDVPLWHNAANAVLVPSDHEGFGLAVLEALACDVPVLATPTGNHPMALTGIDGCLCAPYDRASWRAALAPHVAAADPRVQGRRRAELFSADRMAERVLAAWRDLAPAAV